jgi:GTP 3',8-cyclase
MARSQTPPIDPLGRPITHLRISVTSRCNLNCFYCHREGHDASEQDMSLERIREIVTTLGEMGLRKVKITGGEPLVRKDIVEIVEVIRQSGPFDDISMTTNATRLARLAAPLKRAGLDRVNIGCDSLSSSLSPKTIDSVRPGLEAAVAAGLTPVKLNMVVMRGINDHEIESFLAFSREKGAILQLIELIPFGDDGADPDSFFTRYHVPLQPIRDDLARRASATRVRELQGREQFDVDGATVEIVSPFHRSFCGSCKKLRVTADGQLMPCLVRDDLRVPYTGRDSVLTAIGRRLLPGSQTGCSE